MKSIAKVLALAVFCLPFPSCSLERAYTVQRLKEPLSGATYKEAAQGIGVPSIFAALERGEDVLALASSESCFHCVAMEENFLSVMKRERLPYYLIDLTPGSSDLDDFKDLTGYYEDIGIPTENMKMETPVLYALSSASFSRLFRGGPQETSAIINAIRGQVAIID